MEEIGRKLLSLSELPSGPLDRYHRDMYACICMNSECPPTFEEYMENVAKEDEVRRIEYDKFDTQHPVIYSGSFRISAWYRIHVEKRKGCKWKCSGSDCTPNYSGGPEGDISFRFARKQIRKSTGINILREYKFKKNEKI